MAEHGDGDLDVKELQPGELEVEVYRSGVLMTVGSSRFRFGSILKTSIQQVSELVQLRLLHRIGHADRLDNGVQLKCNITFDTAEKFARELRFNLSELLWDPVQ